MGSIISAAFSSSIKYRIYPIDGGSLPINLSTLFYT